MVTLIRIHRLRYLMHSLSTTSNPVLLLTQSSSRVSVPETSMIIMMRRLRWLSSMMASSHACIVCSSHVKDMWLIALLLLVVIITKSDGILCSLHRTLNRRVLLWANNSEKLFLFVLNKLSTGDSLVVLQERKTGSVRPLISNFSIYCNS
jgi:hypothetical protein